MENVSNITNIYDFPADPYRDGERIFLWGVKSWDDVTSVNPCFHTMNDIEITYDESSRDYALSIETIYHFDSMRDQHAYLVGLLDAFTAWMVAHNYNTCETLCISDVFHWQYNRFPTVSKAYAWFKFMVDAYVEKYK